jgi:hypothetical protein
MQSLLGLCRQCERDTNVDHRTLQQREADHVERMRAQIAALEHAHVEPPQTYTIVVDGVEYEVVNELLGFGRAVAQPRVH